MGYRPETRSFRNGSLTGAAGRDAKRGERSGARRRPGLCPGAFRPPYGTGLQPHRVGSQRFPCPGRRSYRLTQEPGFRRGKIDGDALRLLPVERRFRRPVVHEAGQGQITVLPLMRIAAELLFPQEPVKRQPLSTNDAPHEELIGISSQLIFTVRASAKAGWRRSGLPSRIRNSARPGPRPRGRPQCPRAGNSRRAPAPLPCGATRRSGRHA